MSSNMNTQVLCTHQQRWSVCTIWWTRDDQACQPFKEVWIWVSIFFFILNVNHFLIKNIFSCPQWCMITLTHVSHSSRLSSLSVLKDTPLSHHLYSWNVKEFDELMMTWTNQINKAETLTGKYIHWSFTVREDKEAYCQMLTWQFFCLNS